MIPPMMRRNFSEIYKKMPLSELQNQVCIEKANCFIQKCIFLSQVPSFNFSHYLEPLLPRQIDESEEVVIYALPYLKKLTKLVENTDKRYFA